MSHCREEYFNEALIKELKPLTKLSWDEANCAPGMPYDPDWDKYMQLGDMELLRIFTLRSDSGELMGYITFLVSTTLHSRSTLQALHDSFFILKARRKSHAARDLLQYAEKSLTFDGIEMIIMMVMLHRDYSSTLTELGYHQSEMAFIKRIG